MHSQYRVSKVFAKQNEKMAKLWVFVDFSNKRRFEQIYKTSLQNETEMNYKKKKSSGSIL